MIVKGNLIITNNASLTIYSSSTNGKAVNYGALLEVAGELRIVDNSWLYLWSHPTDGAAPLVIASNIIIHGINAAQTNQGINAVGKGFRTGYGPGKSQCAGTDYDGGGGYGGKGGDGVYYGGLPYGSTNMPFLPGSSSARSNCGGWGGGFIRLEAKQGIQLDGIISANGAGGTYRNLGIGGDGGGGSGGGILIMAKRFFGTNGTISARGGDGFNSTYNGGGGGGRVSIITGNLPLSEHAYQDLRADKTPLRCIFTNSIPSFQGTIDVTNGLYYYNYGGRTPAQPGSAVFIIYICPQGTFYMIK